MNLSLEITHIALRRLGYYRVLFTGAVQFSSIVFRLVVGLLSGISETSLALESGVEFSLNALLEIPCGWFADRYGRVRCSIIGHVGLAFGLVSMHAAVVFKDTHPELSSILVVLDGIILGISKPLFSGSVEAFYQNVLENVSTGSQSAKELISRSFIASGRYGIFVPTLATLSAFAAIAVLNPIGKAHHALLFGVALYGLLSYQIFKDYLFFKNYYSENVCSNQKNDQLLKTFKINHTVWISCILQLGYYVMLVPIMGFGLVSLGRTYGRGSTPWSLLISFMSGYLTLGWYLRGSLLPKLTEMAKTRSILFYLISSITIATVSIIFMADRISPTLWPPVIFFYMALFQLVTGGINSFAVNMLFSETPKSSFALALSIQNMPCYFFTGVYSFIIASVCNGAPSILSMFITVAVGGLFLLCVLPFLEQNEIPNKT